MLNNLIFTDPQGQTHESAVVRVKNATRHINSNSYKTEVFEVDPSDNIAEGVVHTNDNTSTSDDVHCTFNYWSNQSAYESGLQPYILVNPDSGLYDFNISKEELTKSIYDGLSVELIAEKYFIDVILPTLN